MKLEELLNKLINLGWKPRGIDNMKKLKYDEHGFIFVLDFEEDGTPFDMSITELCSIDSGLWQFVCENGLYNKEPKYEFMDMGNKHILPNWYSYRLMLSSTQEDKEKFILDNIVLK